MALPSVTGLLFWLLFYTSSLLGSIFILFPFVPLAYIAPSTWRTCADRIVGYWLTFPTSLCDYIFGVKFYVTGDMIDSTEPALIIMNHRTRLDWMFFWNALYKIDPWLLTTEKIALKKQLEYVPGAGWGMQCAAYMFLERNYKNDMHTMNSLISYYKDSAHNYQILFFPEGTDRGRRAAKLSGEFAKRHNLPIYYFVLHPRTTGFTYMMRLMREKKYVRNVYDVTVGYSDGIVSSELEILLDGRFPRAVHFDIKCYKENELPMDDNELANWLNKLWKDKEHRLEQFYKADIIERKFLPSGEGHIWPVKTTGVGYYCAFFFWFMTSSLWIYFTINFILVRIYILVACTFYFYCQWRYGGFENLALRLFKQQQGEPQHQQQKQHEEQLQEQPQQQQRENSVSS